MIQIQHFWLSRWGLARGFYRHKDGTLVRTVALDLGHTRFSLWRRP